jgi:UDP-N-acetylglucosamine 2-epimerase (non-hydrolysing)
LVGNVMIDTLLANRAKAEESPVLEQLGLGAEKYAVLTLHRPANVDDPVVLGRLLDPIETICRDMPVVFPIHPRTRKNLESSPLGGRVQGLPNLKIVDPMGYLDFLKLLARSRLVLTDSGGIQEETTVLKVPCLTLRENTERPVTVTAGSNRIVGTDPQRILAAYREVLGASSRASGIPPLWDGQAATRIVRILAEKL